MPLQMNEKHQGKVIFLISSVLLPCFLSVRLLQKGCTHQGQGFNLLLGSNHPFLTMPKHLKNLTLFVKAKLFSKA